MSEETKEQSALSSTAAGDESSVAKTDCAGADAQTSDTSSEPTAAEPKVALSAATAESSVQRILIGSQRKTAAPEPADDEPRAEAATAAPADEATSPAQATAEPEVPEAGRSSYPPPRTTDRLTPDLEKELEEALGDASIDELMSSDDESAAQAPTFEPDTKHNARVVSVHKENVFFDLGARNQGVAALKLFAEPPDVGAELAVIVRSFNAEEGLYELGIPGAVVDAGDWSSLEEGMTVSVTVTGENKGGLECQVQRLRGFIPASQIALYRVNNFSEYVGQTFDCVVTEVKPEKRNLVLSRRSVLERERQAKRQERLSQIEKGQVVDGVVRSLRDYGAFVDIDGVDGLLHVSQLSWSRVRHPRDILQEGQRIQVKVLKVDPSSGKISLGLKDLVENPWTDVETKYPVQSTQRGTVVKMTDFGAFVQLEPGVEGLVHISELAHHRVHRVSDVLSADQEVDVCVLSVDPKAKRVGLSIKATLPPPAVKGRGAPEEPVPETVVRKRPSNVNLRGGTGHASGGEQFGLKW